MEFLKSLLLVGALCTAISPPSILAETRAFTLDSGRVIVGEILDSSVDAVTIVEGDKRNSLDISRFSPDDQAFIADWLRKKRGIYEWANERGYAHDGSTDEVIAEREPKVLWRAQAGEGDAPIVANTRWAILTGVKDGRFALTTVSIKNGKEEWTSSYKSLPAKGRATASPSLDRGQSIITSMGPGGRVDAWNLADGTNIWAMRLPDVYRDSERPLGGAYGSPVTTLTDLLVEVGGPAYSVVSIKKKSGREQWRVGRHQSVGASPVIATVGGREVIVSRNQHGIVGRRAHSGVMAWDHAWAGQGEGNAAPLVLSENRIFATTENECAMFQVEGKRTAKLWSSANLCSTRVTPVFKDGFLYGFHGDELRCIEAQSGEVKWSHRGIAAGNLIRAADQLVIQAGKSGEVIFAAASPDGYKERSRVKVFEGASRTLPVLANGYLICRSAAGDVTCLDVGISKQADK